MSSKYLVDKRRPQILQTLLSVGKWWSEAKLTVATCATAHNPLHKPFWPLCTNHSREQLSCKDLFYLNISTFSFPPPALQLNFALTKVCQCGWKWAAVWKEAVLFVTFLKWDPGPETRWVGDKVWMRSSERRSSAKRLKDSLSWLSVFWAHLSSGHWLIYGLLLTDTCFWRQIHCPAVIGSFPSDVPCWGTRRVRRDTSWWLAKSCRKVITAFSTLLTETDPGMSFARRGIGAERALSVHNVTQN